MQRWISSVLENLRERLTADGRSHRLGSYGPEGVGCGVHLAIFVEPYLELVLAGKKTIESRFSANRCPPYNAVKKGDLLLLKRSGGPVVGVATVGQVWSYDLDLGGHLKTDHRGSLQNRPMDITLDKDLFYLTGCLCGNPSFDLVRSDSGIGLECLAV